MAAALFVSVLIFVVEFFDLDRYIADQTMWVAFMFTYILTVALCVTAAVEDAAKALRRKLRG